MTDNDTHSQARESDTSLAQGLDVEAAATVGVKVDANAAEQPFSIFTKREKWALVVMVGMSSLFR